MFGDFIKIYRSKVPYIVLMAIDTICADYIYFNEFKSSELLVSIVLAHVVILKADYFCFFAKKNEFAIRHSLLSGIVIAAMAALIITIMRYMHFTNVSFIGASLFVANTFIFPFIVDASRYTDTL